MMSRASQLDVFGLSGSASFMITISHSHPITIQLPLFPTNSIKYQYNVSITFLWCIILCSNAKEEELISSHLEFRRAAAGNYHLYFVFMYMYVTLYQLVLLMERKSL